MVGLCVKESSISSPMLYFLLPISKKIIEIYSMLGMLIASFSPCLLASWCQAKQGELPLELFLFWLLPTLYLDPIVS
jgi:hypothetical protein